MVCIPAALALSLPFLLGATVDDEVEIQGEYTEFRVAPGPGAGVERFSLRATQANFAGGAGLLLEGFGIGNFYVPNRRLNERLDVVDSIADRPVLEYSYDCDGPNIRGLHVTRRMEPLPNEASIRVTLRIEHKGTEDQWVAPWVRNEVLPGGELDDTDRIDAATHEGVRNLVRSGYYPASRNWIAATDPASKETVYAVFDANQTHSFLVERDTIAPAFALQTAFVPRLMKPADAWESTYRVNTVYGLTHIDFASDELAAQLDFSNGQIQLLLTPTKAIPGLQLDARVLAENGRVWKLPSKKFDLMPGKIIRCSYPWEAPADGAYDFLGRLTVGGKEYALGADTAPPHGGIDTQFVVGEGRARSFEPWTNAAEALNRGSRTLVRSMVSNIDSASIWIESSLEKIFPEDDPKPAQTNKDTAHVALARNETESFQIVLRPHAEVSLTGVNARATGLVNVESSASLASTAVSLHRVMYYPVRVPTHFEGPTGLWPDPLPPLDAFTAQGGKASPIWVNIQVPSNAAPGTYEGAIEITSNELLPVTVNLRVEVFDFELPRTPALKTDFGFWRDGALSLCKRFGYTRESTELDEAYLEMGLSHRVTLRPLVEFPAESADYAASLKAYAPAMLDDLANGATTLSLPPSILDVPEQLALANEFALENNLKTKAFCQIADEPERPAWPRLYETMMKWREIAPDIPLMFTTYGEQPFFHEAAEIWAVHTPLFDTLNNKVLLERIAGGGEVWWYVNHTPPRPYANFFIDFSGVEHRILFWQSWVLGIKGIHYWNVNAIDPSVNPWDNQLDITPANGDGSLLYPGPNGPVSSVRWEIIRDGIEDYDYLVLFRSLMKSLEDRGGNASLLEQAREVYNLKELVPDLVTFPRDPNILLAKRDAIARMIVRMRAATK